jgi:hypothetical protein
MFRILTLFFSLLASLSAGASVPAADTQGWIAGTWTLCEDADGSPKDSLQFNEDGTGLVLRAKGSIEFIYKVSGSAVSLLANANGYAIPINLSAATARDALMLHSEKTGNTSTYVRASSERAKSCSVQ